MRRLAPILAAAVTLLLVGLPARAALDPSTIVVDAESGKVLSDDDSDQLWYPASLTKLMTAYVTFEALKNGDLKPTSAVTVSAHALAQAPSKMGFKAGTVMNFDNALKMMLVKSANDIAMAIAETVGGSEKGFVQRMNATAARLGMVSTHYNNPNGLPDGGQITTARDLAVLARALWNDFPDYRHYFGIPAIKAGKKILRSQNKLLEQYRGTTGMKTGFVCSSGYNIVASANRGGRTVIAVVLGASSPTARNETAARLLDSGFGAWLMGTRPELAAFKTAPATGVPVDMHDVVCGKHIAQEDDDPTDNSASGDAPATRSYLVPRFVLMDPVPVYTGKADGVPDPAPKVKVAKGKTVAVGSAPMPRLRPSPPVAEAQP